MKVVLREELVQRVIEHTRLPETTVWRVFDAVFEEIGRALAQGEIVRISRFGTFDLRYYPERLGVHPRTLGRIPYPTRVAPSFRSSLTLKRAIRQGIEEAIRSGQVPPPPQGRRRRRRTAPSQEEA
ncbi:MAG: HU family DNA-binding protein [Chloroflexia bacterium]